MDGREAVRLAAEVARGAAWRQAAYLGVRCSWWQCCPSACCACAPACRGALLDCTACMWPTQIFTEILGIDDPGEHSLEFALYLTVSCFCEPWCYSWLTGVSRQRSAGNQETALVAA